MSADGSVGAGQVPLGVRLLGYALTLGGLLELTVLLVAALSFARVLLPLVLLLSILAAGTTLTGAGLSGGRAWVVRSLRALVGFGVVTAVAAVAVPHYALDVSASVLAIELPLLAAAGYLRRGVAGTAVPVLPAGSGSHDTGSVSRVAASARSIGGLGLFLWGIAVIVVIVIGCAEVVMSGDAWRELGAAAVVVAAAIYVAPCLAFGYVIWRERPNLAVTFASFALACMTAAALNSVWFIAAVPALIAGALGLGLAAPIDRPAP